MLIDTITQNQALKQDNYGLLQLFDISRSRWLSVSRNSVAFGINHSNLSRDRWFDSIASVGSNTSGYRVPRNCVITSISVQTQNTANCEIKIRKNNIVTNLASITLTAEAGKSLDNLNVEINSGDWIQSFLQVNSGNVDYPIVTIELAWRD